MHKRKNNKLKIYIIKYIKNNNKNNKNKNNFANLILIKM